MTHASARIFFGICPGFLLGNPGAHSLTNRAGLLDPQLCIAQFQLVAIQNLASDGVLGQRVLWHSVTMCRNMWPSIQQGIALMRIM